MKNLYKIEDELYIISNNESINENDHIITQDGRLVEVSYLLSKDVQGGQKVILTTNKLLIKDGIQKINDEFLEWFVKNPSCEWVEVKLQHQYHTSKEYYNDADFVDCSKEQYDSIKSEIPTCPLRILYKIIIPQEEPKQLFTKGDKVLFTGKMLNEEVVDKVVTVFYILGRGDITDMSEIVDEYTHIYKVWNKDLKHIPKEEIKQENTVIEQFKKK